MSTQLNAEDADEHEIFDINDFTTASDWERLIVQIEELIAEWKVNSNEHLICEEQTNVDFENGEWIEKNESIQYDDQTFTISYYSLKLRKGYNNNVELIESEINKEIPQTYEESSAVDFDSLGHIAPVKQKALPDTETKPSNEEISANLPPKSIAELLSRTNDFKSPEVVGDIPTPSLAQWYGLTKFLVISPTRSNNFVKNESEANLILSSVSIAINNTNCLLPIFVQISNVEREMYIGLCEGSSLKTHFQIVHFSYIPAQYAYLSGLLEIFKSKLGAHISENNLLITISVRFSYSILENTFVDWQEFNAQHQKQHIQLNIETNKILDDSQENLGANEYYSRLKTLPFGSYQDCIDSVFLSCVWSNLSEDIIYDSDSYSDLNPIRSNDWTITLNTICDKCDMQLTNLLENFIEETKRTISVAQIIGSKEKSQNDTSEEELKKASLNRLASVGSGSKKLDQVYNISTNIVNRAADRMKVLNINDALLPLDKEILDYIMDYLFPDAKLAVSSNNENDDLYYKFHGSPKYQKFLKKLNLIKASSTDFNGLLNKLAVCMSVANEVGPSRAIAQLWKEFLLELRFRYESSCFIPGLSNTGELNNNQIPPDLSRSLLHQKLMMLNCCIKKRLDRQRLEINNYLDMKERQNNQQGSNDNDDDDDEEDNFFDAEEDDEHFGKEDEPVIVRPEGRFKKFGNSTLLADPTAAIYVPITQEATPMTEDMLEQHASVLLNLGTSDNASLLRAKIQSASLLSDMQSFKAANPKCQLEDFVKWYSPKDYIETIEKVGEKNVKKVTLSERMLIPGNIWIDVWSQSKSIPARKQKRLFDDTKEAENIFDWLNSLSLGQIVEHMLPSLFYSAIHTSFLEALNLELDDYLMPTFQVLIDKLVKISRKNETKSYPELIGFIKAIEQIISLMKSIKLKFNTNYINKGDEEEVMAFIKHLLKATSVNPNCQVKIPDGANSIVGKLIINSCKKKRKYKVGTSHSRSSNYMISESFSDEDDKPNCFEKPFKREYIMRSSVARPAPYSRQSPQRMYCLLERKEFRLAGAFTEDTMFF